MRKIVLQEMVSLDGRATGPNGGFDWPLADEEFEAHSSELLDAADTLLLGRNTYRMFASYWPTAVSSASGTMRGSDGAEFVVPTSPSVVHERVARKMNSYRKIVFSRSLARVEWTNSILAKEIVPESVTEMKEQAGRDMLLLGSIDLAHSFMKHGLIDEYRIWVNPILLGGGDPLFAGTERRKLEFLGTRTFGSGLVELHYRNR
ncbi:MAG: dihydrofolate reductase family protein [Nitrososphaerales archaeon]|jgi:dihydrofolate reductase